MRPALPFESTPPLVGATREVVCLMRRDNSPTPTGRERSYWTGEREIAGRRLRVGISRIGEKELSVVTFEVPR